MTTLLLTLLMNIKSLSFTMKCYFIFIGILGFGFTFGQSQEEKKQGLFNDAEYFFWSEEYKEAIYYYKQLLELDPNNANIHYKIGEAFLNIPGEEPSGIPYFEKAKENLCKKKEYKRKSFSERRAPLHALFYLGNAYRINNELDKALNVYEKFVNSPWYEGQYNLTVVENEIKATERAKIIKDSPTRILQHNFGQPVNSELDEFNPVISGDKLTLVFVRSLKFYDAIFYTVLKNGQWTEPVIINPMIGSDGEMYPTGLSYDGKTLLLVKRQRNNDDIYITSFEDQAWTKAAPVSDNINTRKNEDHASFSKNGQKIFFSSDRRRGEGGYDIWVSHKKRGMWDKPKNLGETINTEFDETTPFPVNNGETVYFSSKGHYNMGGFDVFYSTIDDNQWLTPVNVGYPINTTGDNLFFVPYNKGKNALMSLKKADGLGEQDIYSIDILSKPVHLAAKQKTKKFIEPQRFVTKKSFEVHVIDQLNTDTLGLLRYNKKSKSFEITDYHDNVKFVVD